MPSSSKKVIHGADPTSKGLRPSLRTLCGRFYCANEGCPGNAACTHGTGYMGEGADELIELYTSEGKRKVTCPDCIDVIAAKSAKLAKEWAQGKTKKPWY